MPERKLTLERGDQAEIWAGGRGYQPPAPSGGPVHELPPGWNTAPHEEQIVIHEAAELQEVRNPGSNDTHIQPVPKRTDDELIISAVQTEIARLEIPEELVNIDKGTARFRGHTLRLAPKTQVAIRKLLACEVVLKLKEEQKRVIESVHNKTLQAPSGRARQNVPAVPKPKKPVGKNAQKRSQKVRRVRFKVAPIELETVQRLSSIEGGKA